MAYVVLGWVLLQVADIVIPAIELPVWSMKLILVLLALGFPVALMFSWVFEITAEGIKKEKDVDRSQSVTSETAKKLDMVVIALLVVAIGMFGADRFITSSDTPATIATETVVAAITEDGTPVVAVLPFSARSAGGENDRFLADGIHDDLLTQLAQLDAFKVISRTSVQEYLGTTKNMRQIGEELGAGQYS